VTARALDVRLAVSHLFEMDGNCVADRETVREISLPKDDGLF
jgi:hypothetical protein